MIVYNNQAPDAVNNVGQFGATEGSIGAYKQAAEYAADSKYWALLAESKFGTIDDLIAEVERLYQQGVLMNQDIEDLKQDFIDQDARLMTLIAQTNAAVSDANNAVALINQKLIEVQNQLDVLLGMSVDVTTLPPGTPATGSFNPNTGVISLGIPEGDPGKDGSVKDLDTAPTGVPELGDLGFYVDKDDNTVHKTTLEDIANLIPSVRSVSVNDGPALDGEVALTINKGTVGLSNVENVASYSKEVVDNKVDGFIKTYSSKAEADSDAVNREAGETVLVWEATKYGFYTVAANKTLTPVKTEGRILTVNSRSPDSSGNIDITIPTGNPSLYLGEMVMFPYDPTKDISYPGVLPADGRLVSKESALDLGPSLISGQLPVVSETEWQAGAKQYFSWGKLADGVTDADSTNFINIRLPDWTGGEAIRAPDSDKDSQYNGTVQAQKPYVVTVNNQAPDEITGNVNLSRSILGAASSGANSDITSLNGLTTALSVAQGGTGATTAADARSNLGLSSIATLNTIPIANGGTGATTTLAAATNLHVFAIPNNLSEITDRSAAWLNVRPTGPLPLSSDPVNDLDATTKRWVEDSISSKMTEHIAGLNVDVTSTGITVHPGECYIPSEASVLRLVAPKTIAHSGLTPATKYYIYAYNDSGSLGIEVSTTENVKYGYKASNKQSDTSRRFIGMFYFTGGSEVAICRLIDGECIHLFGWGDIGRVLNNGTSTVQVPVNYEKFIPLAAFTSVKLAVTNTTSTPAPALIAPTGFDNLTAVQHNYCKFLIDLPPSTSGGGSVSYIYAGAPQGGGLLIDVAGYKYDR